MKKDNKIKFFLIIFYIFILTIFLWVFFSNFSLDEITSYEFIKNNRNYLIFIKEQNFLLISILFISFTILWTLMLGFALPIVLMSGFIFGSWAGSILAVIGLTLGATLLYFFVNYFLKDFVKEKFSKKFMKLNEKVKKNEFSFFLIYRFVGGIPFQVQNLLPVLFDVKFKNYFFGSLLGMFPQVFIWVSLGSGIENVIDQNLEIPGFFDLILSKDIYLPIIGFFTLMIIAYLIKKTFLNNNDG